MTLGDLDKALSLTIDDALRIALGVAADNVLAESWYNALEVKLGEAEAQTFAMGLASLGIVVGTPGVTVAPTPIPSSTSPADVPIEIPETSAPDTMPPSALYPADIPSDSLTVFPQIARHWAEQSIEELPQRKTPAKDPVSKSYQKKVKTQLSKALSRGIASRRSFVYVAGKRLTCETAVTLRDKQIGMQKYAALAPDHSMWFRQIPTGLMQMYMGTTQFPLDMLFVVHANDKNEEGLFRITHIAHNVQPGNREIIQARDVDGVLEVGGGFCLANGIGETDDVLFV